MFKSVPRALYITLEDRGRVFRILKNWPERNVQVVRAVAARVRGEGGGHRVSGLRGTVHATAPPTSLLVPSEPPWHHIACLAAPYHHGQREYGIPICNPNPHPRPHPHPSTVAITDREKTAGDVGVQAVRAPACNPRPSPHPHPSHTHTHPTQVAITDGEKTAGNMGVQAVRAPTCNPSTDPHPHPFAHLNTGCHYGRREEGRQRGRAGGGRPHLQPPP